MNRIGSLVLLLFAPIGGGFSVGVSAGGSFGHAVILSEEMIRQTKTTLARNSWGLCGWESGTA